MVSRSVRCQLELKISSIGDFLKCIAWDSSPPGESPIYASGCWLQIYRRRWHEVSRMCLLSFWEEAPQGVHAKICRIFEHLCNIICDKRHTTHAWPCKFKDTILFNTKVLENGIGPSYKPTYNYCQPQTTERYGLSNGAIVNDLERP